MLQQIQTKARSAVKSPNAAVAVGIQAFEKEVWLFDWRRRQQEHWTDFGGEWDTASKTQFDWAELLAFI